MQNDDHQSRFLEAPFVRMLRMRSASLKKGFHPIMEAGNGEVELKMHLFSIWKASLQLERYSS